MTITQSNEKMSDSIEKRPDEKESKLSRKTQFTIQMVGGGIFGALSIVFSAIFTGNEALLPRIPVWGITILDPVSIIWITCLFIFGIESGIMSTFIGFVGLLIFDDSIPIIGPIMKLVATMCLIIVPIIMLKLYKKGGDERKSQKLKNPKNFIITGVIGTVLRIFILLLLNIWVFLTILAPLVEIYGGWTFIVLYVIIHNSVQSLFDLVIPYIIVFGIMDYGLKLDEKFEIW